MRLLQLLSLSSLFVLGLLTASAQEDPKPLQMGTMPLVVDESSGLAVATETSLWTHNDRGGKAEFYEIDLRGELVRTIKMIGVSPIDMEDMAQDAEGNIYFADTGNNRQDRASLKVYKVNPRAIINNEVTPEVIEFTLPDKGLEDKCHYDFEAMTIYKDKIYFFSKDRCDKPDNKLLIFTIPTDAGMHGAKKEGEFFWETPDENIKITSADLSVDGKKLVLLSRDAIHFFFAYRKDQFFGGAYRYLPLDDTKKEAITHLDDCNLYISEESSKGEPGRLFKLNLCKINFE